MSYKWNNAHEWLFESAEKWNKERLLAEFKAIALKLDSDQIQDEFESDMDNDGYFKEIK